jgi:hypothetical protein
LKNGINTEKQGEIIAWKMLLLFFVKLAALGAFKIK